MKTKKKPVLLRLKLKQLNNAEPSQILVNARGKVTNAFIHGLELSQSKIRSVLCI